MSKEKKKPKQQKAQSVQPLAQGQASAATEAANQPHNAKKEALGPNTKRG